MKYLKIFLVLAAIALTGSAFYYAQASSFPFGGTQYYLSGAGITSSSNTVQLTSFKTPDGRLVTMSMFGTIGYGALDPQTTAKIEDISFTGITQNANGTATLTGVSRGLDFVYPYLASTTLSYSHSGGATFIITNTAGFYYNEFAMQNNSNVNTYPVASTSVATKGYVDQVAFSGSGAIAASTINRGYVQIATQAQVAASTNLGSTGAVVVVAASTATSTHNYQTDSNVIPVTNTNGQIDPLFIASTTNTIGKNIQVFTTVGTSTFAVPSGTTNFAVTVVAPGAPGGSCQGNSSTNQAAGGGGAGGYTFGIVNLSATTSVQVFVGATSTATSSQATWSTFGTNGFYLKALGGNAGASLIVPGNNGAAAGGIGGTGVGGSINISGGTGLGGLYFAPTGGTLDIGGQGAASPIGFGQGGFYDTGAGALKNATGYGAGGAGAICQNGSSAFNQGSSATQGIVIVQW